MRTYQQIAQRPAQVPVHRLCRVLHMAPAAYYAWQRHRQQARAEPVWQVAVRESFVYHSQRYGTRRLRAEVQAQGHAVGCWRIRRVLHAHGLRAQQPRSFVLRTTGSPPPVRAAPNRLLGQPTPTKFGWATSRTCPVRAGAGFTWTCDWTAARVKSSAETCATRCWRAWAARHSAGPWPCVGPRLGSVVHSDQGSQYTVTRFRDILARNGAVQSMSRRGNCYDNAYAESFWSRFKAELLDGGSFLGLTKDKLEINRYIAYYNAERRHSALGYLAPNHFKSQLKTTSQLCPA